MDEQTAETTRADPSHTFGSRSKGANTGHTTTTTGTTHHSEWHEQGPRAGFSRRSNRSRAPRKKIWSLARVLPRDSRVPGWQYLQSPLVGGEEFALRHPGTARTAGRARAVDAESPPLWCCMRSWALTQYYSMKALSSVVAGTRFAHLLFRANRTPESSETRVSDGPGG